MSKIKELLRDKNTILVFDIDGVLAILEFGEYNHYGLLTDEEWNEACKTNNFYTEDKVSKRMQRFIKERDKCKVYVISKVNNRHEVEHKKEYASKYYGIPLDNIYLVERNYSKIDALNDIKKRNKGIKDSQIVMIDDTDSVLTEVEKNTKYSTAHISTFLDL